jgi:hypothetical protein
MGSRRGPHRFPAWGPRSTGDQYRERIAGQARANPHLDVSEAGVLQQLREPGVVETEPPIAQAIADPLLVVLAQIEHQHASAGTQNANGLRNRL